MKRLLLIIALGGSMCAILTSCSVRSISDSDYRGGYGYSHSSYYGRSPDSVAYHGELTEWDILGTGNTNAATSRYEPVSLRKGERILVIQSGAFFPDEDMVRQLQANHTVAMFSGIPPRDRNPVLAEHLRTAALNGGCERLLVYWGVLESERRDHATTTVSWTPVVGAFVPDTTQRMRIRVKAFVVDTTSGHWSAFIADSFEDERLSAPLAREISDQRQVARLKALAYRNLVNKLR